jgi:hypothetical protein
MAKAATTPSNETPQARLMRYAHQAVKAHPTNYQGALNQFRGWVRPDPDAVWELLKTHFEVEAQRVLALASVGQKTTETPRPRPVAGGEAGQDFREGHLASARPSPSLPPKTPVKPTPAIPAGVLAGRAALAQKSLLDSFMINGQPIGDVTAHEARGWAASRRRDALFVEMLTENLPLGLPIRKFRTAEDAARLYEQAKGVTENV